MADTHETHAEITAEMRFHGQQNIDAEKDEPEFGILTMEGRIALNYADRLEAAHKRESEIADAKIADLQSRVKLWTDRSTELVKKCDEHYANSHKLERGDAAKLREALAELVANIEMRSSNFGLNVMVDTKTYLDAKAALAATATTENPSAVGDCAKLREAAKRVQSIMERLYDPTDKNNAEFVRIWEIVSAALAAPPRNCDRSECATTKAASDVWRKEDGGKTAYHDWLLVTAMEKEGGNK